MPIAQLKDIKLYYELHGTTGDPLVLISGTGGDHLFWEPHLNVLSKHFQLITFDNRGIGQTDIPDAPYSLKMMADDIAHLMDYLSIERAHILGFSMGGAIAQVFALNHPKKVAKLMICGSYAKMNPQTRLYLDAVLACYQAGISAQHFYELILPWLFSPRYFENEANLQKMAYNPDDPYPQPLHGFKWQYLAQRDLDIVQKLETIQAKTLIIAGSDDRLTPIHDSQIIADKIKQSQLVIIPNTGHLFNYEEPEIFHSLIISFLNEES